MPAVTTWITICDTCKRADWEDRGAERTDGEVLADLIEASARGKDAVRTRRHSCLMGCTSGCNVTVQAAGKIAYTLGDFEPEETAASAIVDYAALHAASASGQVPYKTWPQGVKGHFITRHPALPAEDGEA
jgi:predicted metal-binding protein